MAGKATKTTKPDIKLNSYESLFGDRPDYGDATELPIKELHDYKQHPFRVIDDEDMLELVQSIKDKGILVPLTVRPVPEGDYEIISGHRRKHAAEIAGLTTVPAIIRDLSDEDAVDIMIYSNIQRTNILPSEKANAYRLQIANFAVYNFLLIKFVQINTVSQVIRSIPFICSTCTTIIKMREMLLYSKKRG